MKKLNLLLIISVLFFATACDDHNYTEFDKKTFDTERAKWFDKQITDYRFHMNYFSDAGPEEAIIIVKNGVVETIEPVSDEFYEFMPRFTTVTAIYDDIALAFVEHSEQIDKGEIKGVTIKIKYNAKYHYPEEVNYSVGYNETMDGGYYYSLKISDFTLLQ